jgi:RNA polymerase sigma factor (TIGR02999 family)
MSSRQPTQDAASPSGAVEPSAITRLLSEWSEGDGRAFDRLMTLVYDDLKAIAHRRLGRERVGHTLNTTALVHEAYVRLAETSKLDWHDRAHFFAVASRVMRHVLVDYARSRDAKKRGGGRIRVTLTSDAAAVEEPLLEVLALEEALSALAERAPRLERVVECRFFGGMSVKETAAALDVSTRTVKRDWRRARAYLYRALTPESGEGPE